MAKRAFDKCSKGVQFSLGFELWSQWRNGRRVEFKTQFNMGVRVSSEINEKMLKKKPTINKTGKNTIFSLSRIKAVR